MDHTTLTRHKDRRIAFLFAALLSLCVLSSILMDTADSHVTSYESVGMGIVSRLLSIILLGSWAATMTVMTIVQWRELTDVARLMGLSPLVIVPLFFILRWSV